VSELPESWAKCSLENFALVNMGQSPKGVFVNGIGDGMPFYQGKTEFGKLYPSPRKYCVQPTKIAQQEDILMSVRAPVGPTNLCPEESCIGRGLAGIRAYKKLSQPYLHHYLRSLQPWLSQQGTGSTFKAISGSFLREVEVVVAPLNEQIRIANKLDSLLAKVDNAQARLEKIPTILKRFRQSVLAAATSGELTREWREINDYATAEMLEKLVKPKKPARYKSRNTGFIEGVVATAVGKPSTKLVDCWEWVPLVDVAVMGTGHTPSRSKPEYWGGEVDWIGIKDARNNHAGTILETVQKTNELGLKNSAARILPKDTVCISRTASVGYIVKMGKPMATSQDFVTWSPTEALSPDWLKWLFVSEKESLFRYGRGTTHTTIYFPEWLSMHVALPPLEEQKEIVCRLEALFSLADSIERKYFDAKQRADRLTQSLLAKAFRGELVPQDPKDEPAEVLLKNIKSEMPKAKVKPKK
jgi:type I restriction enzyme S subunit